MMPIPTIGHDALIGLGSRLSPHVMIGDNAAVGAVRDVDDEATDKGVPAR